MTVLSWTLEILPRAFNTNPTLTTQHSADSSVTWSSSAVWFESFKKQLKGQTAKVENDIHFN
jgi:hypothetical protein